MLETASNSVLFRPANRVFPAIISAPPVILGAAVRNLGPTTDEKLLRYLDTEPRRAEQQYRLLRAKLIKFFDHNGCLDSEDLADEVFCRSVQRLADGLELFAANPASFFWGVARMVLLEYRRRPTTEPLDAEDKRIPAVEGGKAISAAYLAECLGHLRESERAVLLLWYSEGVERLSRRLGISPNGLRLRIHRIRAKLKHLEREPMEDGRRRD